jgi:hypothetical protein
MTSNMIYIVAFGVGLKYPHKIHFNTQCPPIPRKDIVNGRLLNVLLCARSHIKCLFSSRPFFLGKSLTSEILSPSCHQSKNNANATFDFKENGKEYIIASPGYPLSYPFAAM